MTDRTCINNAGKPAGERRRFRRNEDGAVAIEFVALALPFFLLVFAIVESCVAFTAQQVLATATDDVARQFRTGQIRPAHILTNPNLVRDRICERMELMVSSGCPELVVDLKSYDTFQQAADKHIDFTGSGSNRDINVTGFGIDVGSSGSKNQLRVFYRWPVMTDFMRKSMSTLKDGKTLLYASVTWQNEPFDD